MYLGDFHIHSTFSDGKLTIPALVDYFGERGFGAIAITDHLCEQTSFLGKASAYLGCTLTKATFPLYKEILASEADRAWDQYRMRLIPGVEITKNSVSNHRSAHILALGVTEYISPEGDPIEIIRRIHEAGGIAVAAHPVQTEKFDKQTLHLWDRREELKDHFDAWEVASGPELFASVKNSGFPMLASSDFHKPGHMTSWKTLLRGDKTEHAILNSIQKQKVDFHFYQEVLPYGNRDRGQFPLLGGGLSGHSLGNLAGA